jgi:sugar phosphate isomerase/epimerase
MFQLDPRPRQGIVPWAQIISAIRATGYDGWLSLELEKRW